MFADHHDSLIALADSLGLHPCCGAELGACDCVANETHEAWAVDQEAERAERAEPFKLAPRMLELLAPETAKAVKARADALPPYVWLTR